MSEGGQEAVRADEEVVPLSRVRELGGLTDARIYDLRHTLPPPFASGPGLLMIDKLLGHTQVQADGLDAHLAADGGRRRLWANFGKH